VSANGLHQVRNDRCGRAAGLVAAHASGAAARDGKAVVAGRRGRPNLLPAAMIMDAGLAPTQSGLPALAGLMPISGIPEVV
jgi:hypothetical protein